MKSLLHRVRYAKASSALVRALLRRIYIPGRVYTIPFGPCRGFRLNYKPDVHFHTILGLWELENFALMNRLTSCRSLLGEDAVIYDVGANLGLYALWLARHAAPRGTVFAFEAAPRTFERLRETAELNHADNVRLQYAACADLTGEIEFYVGNHHHISSLNANWACEGRGEAVRIQVPATTLDEFCYGKNSRPPPNFIKIDIEGGAARALKGAELCLQRARPAILIESHNLEEERAISDCIIRHRYEAMRTEDRQWISYLDNTLPETRQGWGTLLLVPREARESFSKIL